MSYRTYWEKDGVHWIYTGSVNLEQIQQADDEVYTNPKFADVSYVIWDASAVTELDLSGFQVDIQVVRDISHTIDNDSILCAFVCHRPNLIGMAHQYIALASKLHSNWQFQVFDNLPQARKWILENTPNSDSIASSKYEEECN